jgi:hypothetical protein
MEGAILTDAVTETIFKSDPCPFCKAYNGEIKQIPDWDKRVVEHLIIIIAEDGSFHVHGPVDNDRAMERLIDCAMQVKYQRTKEKPVQNAT